MITRRSALFGLLFAPAIIRTPELLMPIKSAQREGIIALNVGRFGLASPAFSLMLSILVKQLSDPNISIDELSYLASKNAAEFYSTLPA